MIATVGFIAVLKVIGGWGGVREEAGVFEAALSLSPFLYFKLVNVIDFLSETMSVFQNLCFVD